MNSKNVVKNAGWIIGVRIIQSVLSLIISMLTARYLGPSNYGIISYAASLTAFVLPIMQLGLSNILVQEIINEPEKDGETIGTATVMGVVSACFCVIGIIAFSTIVNKGETETILVCGLYALSLVFQAIELVQYWFQAKLLSKYTSIASLIAYIIMSLYKVYLLISGKSVAWFAISYSIDYLLIAVVLIVIYTKKSKHLLKFSWEKAKQMFSRSRYYIISSLMVTVFAQTDRIMIKLMIGNSETGFYSAAISCAGITSFVFSAIIDSMRPVIFESKKESENKFKENMINLYSIIIYLSLAQSIVISMFSGIIVRILYGVNYLNSVSVLRIIVWYTTFSYLGSVRNVWILAHNKQKYLWIINLSGALLNVCLNYILIPVWGSCGAALASLITQIFTNVIISFIIKEIRENGFMMIRALNMKHIKKFVSSLR